EDALRHLAHPVAGNQGRRARRREVNRVVQAKPLELEDVPKTPGDQETKDGAVPLDHRVDRDRRAVEQVGDVAGRDTELRDQRPKALHHAGGRVGSHRGELEAGELSRVLPQQAEVGERSPDVDAEPVAWHCALPNSWWQSRHAERLAAYARRSRPSNGRM